MTTYRPGDVQVLDGIRYMHMDASVYPWACPRCDLYNRTGHSCGDIRFACLSTSAGTYAKRLQQTQLNLFPSV